MNGGWRSILVSPILKRLQLRCMIFFPNPQKSPETYHELLHRKMVSLESQSCSSTRPGLLSKRAEGEDRLILYCILEKQIVERIYSRSPKHCVPKRVVLDGRCALPRKDPFSVLRARPIKLSALVRFGRARGRSLHSRASDQQLLQIGAIRITFCSAESKNEDIKVGRISFI